MTPPHDDDAATETSTETATALNAAGDIGIATSVSNADVPSILRGVVAEFTSRRTVHGLLGAVLDHLAEPIHLAGVIVGVVADDELELVATHGYDEGVVDPFARMPLSLVAPITDAARDGSIVLITDLDEAIERYPVIADTDPRTSALAALPLVAGRRRIGAIGFSFATIVRFDRPLVELMSTLGSLAVLALDDYPRRADGPIHLPGATPVVSFGDLPVGHDLDESLVIRHEPAPDTGEIARVDEVAVEEEVAGGVDRPDPIQRLTSLEREVESLRALIRFFGEIANERFTDE
jgi:hypothetical protein